MVIAPQTNRAYLIRALPWGLSNHRRKGTKQKTPRSIWCLLHWLNYRVGAERMDSQHVSHPRRWGWQASTTGNHEARKQNRWRNLPKGAAAHPMGSWWMCIHENNWEIANKRVIDELDTPSTKSSAKTEAQKKTVLNALRWWCIFVFFVFNRHAPPGQY